ncbi:MAG: hypothetical protein AMXMBFR26_07000 [Porticoccaceae bacterium]
MSNTVGKRKKAVRSFEGRRAALEARARNVSGCELVGAYLRGQAAAGAGLCCGWRDPGEWGELACRVCGGGGLLREAVRLYRDGGELLADFVRMSECLGCGGSGLDVGAAVGAGQSGGVVLLASLRGRA